MHIGKHAPRNWLEAIHQVRMSYHASQRASQRGLKLYDISLVMEFGELVDDGYLMSDKAIARAREALKHNGCDKEMQRLDHLAGIVVVEEGNTIVTAYRADKKRMRRLRSGRIKTSKAGQGLATVH